MEPRFIQFADVRPRRLPYNAGVTESEAPCRTLLFLWSG